MGHSEEIERILEEMEENDGDTIPISETFFFIPNNSIVGIQRSKIDYNIQIGKKSRLIGNYDVKGNIFIGNQTIIHGTIKTTGDVFCGKKVKIQGNINSNGNVQIEEKSKVAGNIHAEQIILSKEGTVNGKLFAKKGISFVEPSSKDAEEKLKRFETNADIVDEVENMLE